MIKVQAVSRNTRIHFFLLAASFLLIIVPVLNKTPSQQISEKSLYSAAEFLLLVDTEEYAKSWDISSDALKKMLTQNAWNEQITKIRAFLGPILERTQQNVAYTNTASDVPEGEYVVMTFASRFELRDHVTETVTLILGEDGQWQVAGYFLR